ncbi:MAG: hypothetical protein EBR22_01370 [Cytophagia bacterium]|nr:hypothetical protein [Cytophagia bacterium]
MKAVSLTLVFRVGQTLGSMAMLWLTAAWMGPVLRGQTSLVNSLVHLAVLFSGFGAGSGMLYASSRVHRSGLLRWLFVFALGGASLSLALGSWGGLHGSFEDDRFWSIGLLCMAFFQAWLAGQRALALGQGHLELDRWTGTASAVLPALGLGICFAMNYPPSLGLYLAVWILSLVLVTSWANLKTRSLERTPQAFSPKAWEEQRSPLTLLRLLWSKNRWTASANLAQFLVYRLQYGVLLVGWGEATLGVYSVAIVAAETLWLITQSYSTVLLARLSSHRGEPTGSQILQSWVWAKHAFAWTVLAVIGLLLLPSTWLEALLGLEYAAMTSWWWSMAPGILGLSWSNVLIHHFTALGMVRVSFYSSAGSALLTALGLGYAMDLGGVVGVASWWSLVLVLNAMVVGGYFLNRYRSYLWPPSG